MDKGKLNFIFAIIIILAIIISCGKVGRKNDNDDDDKDTKSKTEKYLERDDDEEAEEDDNEKQKIVYGNPFILSNSNYTLIPLRLVSTDESLFNSLKREYFSPQQFYSKYSDNYNRLNYNNMYNVIYYNSANGEAYSLLNRKALINKFFIPTEVNADTSRGRFIIFTLVEEDFNNDKEIDEDDAETVYKCNILGQDIRQISPDRIKLTDWEVDTKSDIIYLSITTDVDGNKKFDDKDISKIIKTSISDSNIGTEILSDSLKSSMNSLYIK
jgi:hypothetical protein